MQYGIGCALDNDIARERPAIYQAAVVENFLVVLRTAFQPAAYCRVLCFFCKFGVTFQPHEASSHHCHSNVGHRPSDSSTTASFHDISLSRCAKTLPFRTVLRL